MNLRGVANCLTRAINPNVTAQVFVCAGYQTNAAGRQVATYMAAVPVTVQAQALTKRDLEHLASLNISDSVRPVYVNQQLTGVDRVQQSGGDILDMSDGRWLVTAVLEGWTTAGWCKVALTRQIDTAPLEIVPGVPVWLVEDWQGDTNG